MIDNFSTDFHASQNLTGATLFYERAGMHVVRIYVSYEKELRAGIELSKQAIPIS
jgi:mycothiol synthase